MQRISEKNLIESIARAKQKWEENKKKIEDPPVKLKGCDLCDYTGWIEKGGSLTRCECAEDEVRTRKQKEIDDLVARYRMGIHGYTRTFAKGAYWKELPGQEGLRQRLDRYVERIRQNEPGNLLLLGSTGAGKTWSASYIIGQLDVRSGYKEPHEVRYCAAVSWGRVLSALKMTFKNEEEHKRILDTLYETEVLVIDDLGMEQKTTENYEASWSVSELYQMIDYRWGSPRWTIITTNKSEEEVAARFGEAFHSRVFNTSFKIRLSKGDHRSKGTEVSRRRGGDTASDHNNSDGISVDYEELD